jgi:hypothetical protein
MDVCQLKDVQAKSQYKFSNHRNSDRWEKRREAPGNLPSASSYYLNVNRTSLDHLLLGGSADVDKSVDCPEYTARSPYGQNKSI